MVRRKLVKMRATRPPTMRTMLRMKAMKNAKENSRFTGLALKLEATKPIVPQKPNLEAFEDEAGAAYRLKQERATLRNTEQICL